VTQWWESTNLACPRSCTAKRERTSQTGTVSKVKRKMTFLAGHWWLTPVILATQEAGIRKITVPSQPEQIVLEIYLEKPITKKGWWSGSRYGS
jgi:hypothetical protein